MPRPSTATNQAFEHPLRMRGLDAAFGNEFGDLRRWLGSWRKYRQTYDELRHLSECELQDIGIAGLDILCEHARRGRQIPQAPATLRLDRIPIVRRGCPKIGTLRLRPFLPATRSESHRHCRRTPSPRRTDCGKRRRQASVGLVARAMSGCKHFDDNVARHACRAATLPSPIPIR
jgi:uncharacterized protein YjiS (DUF1127 family)